MLLIYMWIEEIGRMIVALNLFFFSSRRRHTRSTRDWSSDVCSSDLHQGDIWFQTYVAMFAETGEDPTHLSIALDAEANTTLGAPTDDPLKEGQIINEEIDATVQGYRGQVNHSIFVGGAKTAGYDYYRAAVETAIKLFHECVAFILPGKTTCG